MTEAALLDRIETRQRRSLPAAVRAINTEARTVELSFSSEMSYPRYWGNEILDHSPSSVRLGRLNNGGAVLVDHDTADHVGVVERAYIGPDRKGRALVRFGKSQRAAEVFGDVADGIRSLVSVGYRIHDMQLESSNAQDGETYRVIDWEPYELSVVSVPADPSVGVGRSTTFGEHRMETTELSRGERRAASGGNHTDPRAEI